MVTYLVNRSHSFQKLDLLAEQFSPGAPFQLTVVQETIPKVHFKKPYKGLQVGRIVVFLSPYSKFVSTCKSQLSKGLY